MLELSSDKSEQVFNKNNFDAGKQSIGSANTLKRAMTVNKLSEMLDCINDMKIYAKTIEQDLPEYLNTIHINPIKERGSTEFDTEDILQLAKQCSDDDRYILLNDLIKQEKVCFYQTIIF